VNEKDWHEGSHITSNMQLGSSKVVKSDALVEISDYDESWPEKFQVEQEFLSKLLAPWLAGEIEHIGSTAVPGLAAKPVIDLMAPVASLEASRAIIEILSASGYCYSPYKAEIMHWFCKPSPELRTHHLHVLPVGSELWSDRLIFRDALQLSAPLRTQYAGLKRELAGRSSRDRDGYTEAKSIFINRVLASSRAKSG
jgi:GrpB-like predicted nucleotidyltransferase (UPF0157 family)